MTKRQHISPDYYINKLLKNPSLAYVEGIMKFACSSSRDDSSWNEVISLINDIQSFDLRNKLHKKKQTRKIEFKIKEMVKLNPTLTLNPTKPKICLLDIDGVVTSHTEPFKLLDGVKEKVQELHNNG